MRLFTAHQPMRLLLATSAALLSLATQVPRQSYAQTTAPACVGLCQQQVSCPAGGTTTISGTVYAPNGVDPLPNVTVYIPNASVDAFTAGVSCPVVGQPPSGSPLIGTTTAADGTFTLVNAPVGSNIPLVVQAGRWRRQVVIPGTTACTSTAFSTRLPRNQTEGDIPHIAIATGSQDAVECVLRKVGIDDAEFTNPLNPGRIHLYSADNSPGARVDTSTPKEAVLMGNLSTLNQYDAIMLPCEGSPYIKPSAQLANLIQYANAGGRVYASHYSYAFLYQNPPFDSVVNWQVNQSSLPDGIATVDTTFADGQTLSQWLQIVGATTTPGQMAISTLRHDLNGVNPPTQSWLRLNDTAHNNPVMQFTFSTPVSTTANQCGRVLFNEYHVENPTIALANKNFPTECASGAMTPQEKLLEYSLFALTNDGGAPTLDPTSQDFGSQAIGFATAPKTFIFKNNSTFSLLVSSLGTTGDFTITSPACGSVAAGASCNITVVFQPSALGPRTGTLTVVTSSKTLTSTLTGTGTPALTSSPASLDFGSLDVGASATKSIVVLNNAPGPVPVPAFQTTGDYSSSTNCGATLGSLATCSVNITFKPTTTGPRTGSMSVNSTSPAYTGVGASLTGNGIDFTLALTPTSGSTIAGIDTSTSASFTPLAGFAAPITISCSSNAPASICTPAIASTVLSAATKTSVTITTTAQYKVIGYGGFGGKGLLSLLAIVSTCLFWKRRSRTALLSWSGLAAFIVLAASLLTVTGCSGKIPDRNSTYTTPGPYTYTVTATDGFLTHSATYTLQVTAK